MYVTMYVVKNAAGVNGWVKDVDPISAIGAGNWSDYTVSAEVRIASTHTKEDARMETDKCGAREGQRWRVSGTLIQAYENATSHWLCLEVDTTVVDSAPLQLRECVPGRMQQQWDVRENGWIVSRFNGGCLDVHGNTVCLKGKKKKMGGVINFQFRYTCLAFARNRSGHVHVCGPEQ